MDLGETTAVVVLALTLSFLATLILPGGRRASIRSKPCAASDRMSNDAPVIYLNRIERHYRQGDDRLDILKERNSPCGPGNRWR